jgi:hypothetical protein
VGGHVLCIAAVRHDTLGWLKVKGGPSPANAIATSCLAEKMKKSAELIIMGLKIIG